MKKISLFCLLIASSIANGQNVLKMDYSAVDNYVLTLKKEQLSIPELSKVLTKNFKSEEEKVRAIFRWMTNNISYDCKTARNNGRIKGLYYDKDKGTMGYYRAVTDYVYDHKTGICMGYAMLFEELCKYAGIKTYLVNGITGRPRTVNFFRRMQMFNTSHQWNKVKIGEDWYFIDVTWASGYCNPAINRFTKSFNPDYYLVPEKNLYATHAEEKTESADFNDALHNSGYPNHKLRRPCLNIFYCTDW